MILSKDFLAQYLWLIVIGVIVLLALIGFIADKTGFLKKKEVSDEKPKEDKKDEANYNIGLNDAVVDTVKNDDDIFNEFTQPEEDKKDEVKSEEEIKEEIPSELYAPIEEKKTEVSDEKVVDFSDDEVWKF